MLQPRRLTSLTCILFLDTDGDKLKWLSEVVLVNPQIVEKSGKTDVEEEGCLSFPGMAGDVRAFACMHALACVIVRCASEIDLLCLAIHCTMADPAPASASSSSSSSSS